MNAGRDVERLIAAWLVEEAPARAPDRILGEAAHRIDRMKQQRFAAAWREPMIISTGRLLVAAAVVIAVVVGAGWLGRMTAAGVGGAGPSPAASPSTSPSQAPTLESFRAARDAICQRAAASASGLNDQLTGVFDPGLSDTERSAKIDVLQQIVTRSQALRTELSALDVPPQIAADQTAALTRGEDVQAILEQEILLLRAGKLSEAQQLDLMTDPINRMAEQFEQRYSLAPCP